MFKLRRIVVAVMGTLILAAPSAFAQSVNLTGPKGSQLIQGTTYPIRWQASGVKSVSLNAEGELISIPEANRGRFTEKIAEGVSASQESYDWKVPFLDTRSFQLELKGYDSKGQLVAQDRKTYQFRPQILKKRTANGIYVDLTRDENQRLYVLKNNKVIRSYLVSGGRSRSFSPPNVHPKRPHDHAGVFRVIQKKPYHWSRLYQVDMPYAMRFLNGHFIHATSPSHYDELGGGASSGCVRLSKSDARDLYSITRIGTRVEVFGPR